MTIANENILIIGVDPAICNSLTALFRKYDYTVHLVQTVKEGLSALQQQAFCAVALLEPVLSDNDGRELRDILVKSNPPIIVFTESLEVGSTKENEFIERGAFGPWEMSWDRGLSLLFSEGARPGGQPFYNTQIPAIDPKVNAEKMIRQNDQLYAKFKKYKFKFLAETAREWSRLIDAGSVSESEVAALVAIVTQGRWRGPRWVWLAHYISRWARFLGFPGVDFNAIKNGLPEEPKENGY